MSHTFSISGNVVDLIDGRVFAGTVFVDGGRIAEIRRSESTPDQFIIPGFIDAHVHIESSMLVPSEFARLAVAHGTVGSVSDPHEIANVLGISGVEFMLENAKKTPFKFCFGAPSCVPATSFETAGARLGVEEVKQLLDLEDIGYLAEVMNFPGVLNGDAELLQKIEAAQVRQKPVDGHAPGLSGVAAQRYAGAGITTDHECFGAEEARDKLACGMKILIREGSAARNFDELVGLINEHPDSCMFCSDDKHPDELVRGHINDLLKRAVSAGVDPLLALRAATVNPISHYGLNAGLLRRGDPADFVVVEDLDEFSVCQTYIDGELVSENGTTLLRSVKVAPLNKFVCKPVSAEDFRVAADGSQLRVIVVEDGQIVTGQCQATPLVEQGLVESDTESDILMAAVINRYEPQAPAVGFVKGFGLKSGALASSVAHDSHNIVAVGASRDEIARAVNLVIENQGGISAISENNKLILGLPVGGLMSAIDGYQVAELYQELDQRAKELGSQLSAPFMTLSFLALLVIPELKLSDKGLFDGLQMEFTSLFVD